MAAVALTRLGAAAATPAFTLAVRNPNVDPAARRKVLEALGNFGTEAHTAAAVLTEEFAGRNVPPGRAPLEREDKLEVLKVLTKVVTPSDRGILSILTDEFAGKNLPKGRGPISGEEKQMLLPILACIATAEDKNTIAALEAVANDTKLDDKNALKKNTKDVLKKLTEKK